MAPDYSKNLALLADRLLNGGPARSWVVSPQVGFDGKNPDPRFRMLRGDWIGGCGFQPNGYSVIDVNFLGGPALAPYHPDAAAVIQANTQAWLAGVRYAGNGRHETLFGRRVPAVYGATGNVRLFGEVICPPPPLGNVGIHVLADMPDPTRPITVPAAPNHLTPLALNAAMHGDMRTTLALHETAVGWWRAGRGIGFACPANPKVYQCRDLSYYLILVRALRIDSPIAADVEARLWSLQAEDLGNGISAVYNFDGSLPPHHTTTGEGNALALLPYDSRLTTTWFPR